MARRHLYPIFSCLKTFLYFFFFVIFTFIQNLYVWKLLYGFGTALYFLALIVGAICSRLSSASFLLSLQLVCAALPGQMSSNCTYRSEQNYSSSVSEAWPLDWMFFSQAPTLGDAGFEPGTSAIAVCHSYQLRHPSPFVVLIRINIYFLTNKWILLEGKIIPPYYDKLADKEGVIRGGVRRPNTNRGQETVLLVLFFCFICIQVLCYFLLIYLL